jgi:hypothetical protein
MSLNDDEIVVLVKHRNTYRWFVSEPDFWVLDQDSWRRAFVAAGYGDDDPAHTERFGIAVVNESNAADFLKLMEKYTVDVHTLSVARTVDGDVAYPSLFVDFDRQEINLCNVESPAFEDYLPPGWRAEITWPEMASFLDFVPEDLRYWVTQ